MELISDKGIRSPKWFSNEMLRSEDVNFLSEAFYTNLVNVGAMIAKDGLAIDDQSYVIAGLQLIHTTALTMSLKAGLAVSFEGYYLLDDVWGFVDSAGDIFGAIVPKAQSVSVDAGDTNPRIDILEIRPVRTDYDLKSRAFKDPITGLVSSTNANTKTDYSYGFQIKKGTPAGSPVAPARTNGWIKIAEIYVPALASSITQSNIKDVRDSATWTTGTGSSIYRTTDAVNSLIADVGGYFTSSNVEGALQEVAGLVAAKNSIEITKVADQSISIGDIVGLQSSEKIIKTMHTQEAAWSDADSGASGIYASEVQSIGDSRFAVVYAKSTGIYIRLGELSGGAISWITSVIQASTDTTTISEVHVMGVTSGTDKGRFMIAWTTGAPATAKGRWGRYDGAGGITWDTSATTLDSTLNGSFYIAWLGTGSHGAFLFDKSGYYIRIFEYNSGHSWLSSSTLTGANYISGLRSFEPDYFLVAWPSGGNLTNVRVGHYSGGSVTWDCSASAVDSSWYASSYTVALDRSVGGRKIFVVFGFNASSPYEGKYRIGELINGAIRWGTVVTFGYRSDGLSLYDFERQSALLSGGVIGLYVGDASSPYYSRMLYFKWNGDSIKFLSELTVSTEQANQPSCDYLVDDKIVIGFSNAGNTAAKASIVKFQVPIGVAKTAGSAGSNIVVLLKGLFTLFSSLNIGEEYFVNFSNAQKSLVYSPYKLGKALSATVMNIDMTIL